MLIDSFGRKVSYIRISVTDRCNLRCLYCRSLDDFRFLPHKHILTYEDILILSDILIELGVRKIRLTGGEPLIRRDFIRFLEVMVRRYPGLDLRLTTNAVLLSSRLSALKDMGITRINISLDTLEREKYHRITGGDFYPEVRKAIDRALEGDFSLKINAVAIKGVNDDELKNFLEFACANPLQVRFIEFMPIGGHTMWKPEMRWKADDILNDARKYANLSPIGDENRENGPARAFAIENGKGSFGIISPITNHFCDTCNRLRITADGRLRTCLFSDREYRLREIIRRPELDRRFASRVIKLAMSAKPIGHEILQKKITQANSVCDKIMSSIGG